MHVSWAEELDKAAHCLHCCLIYTFNNWLQRPWKMIEDGVKVNELLVRVMRFSDDQAMVSSSK